MLNAWQKCMVYLWKIWTQPLGKGKEHKPSGFEYAETKQITSETILNK